MAKALAVGDKAPEFALPNETGKTVKLKDFKGQPVVLYFYPKDDTPGCTKEACNFRDALETIKKTGAVVLGVSLDSKESHQKFIAKHQLPFSLLSDEEATVSKAYGVYKQKNMYGKTFWGIERSTFVIDSAGRVKAIFRKVKVDGHVDEVLAALKT
ncbi:MAG TPA: thioredoxin-dependent thiol peroxidase [Nitrospiraceae bacterium]|jgi:peroxiredoxin Q/BCP|nr:thioredoxin-dependent thiol peroxidase [Nitrospiraceae bacterium]